MSDQTPDVVDKLADRLEVSRQAFRRFLREAGLVCVRAPGLNHCDELASITDVSVERLPTPSGADLFVRVRRVERREPEQPAKCLTCYECAPERERMTRMFICPGCGNKRCPHATDHRLDCTGSNEPNQPGSRYASPPESKVVDLMAALEASVAAAKAARRGGSGVPEANRSTTGEATRDD